MIKKIQIENKNREALYQHLAKIASIDEFYYKEEEEKGNLFKSSKFKMIAVKKTEVKQWIEEYIKKITSMMKIPIQIVVENNEILNIQISTDESILIGKNGRTIEALQTLLNQSLRNQIGFSLKINLDISNYKKNKQKKLETVIETLAQEVINSKIEVKLDPMNAYERRIVHQIISAYEELKTESRGEEPNRYIMIQYKN